MNAIAIRDWGSIYTEKRTKPREASTLKGSHKEKVLANKTKKDWLEGKRKQGVCSEQYSNIK